MRILAVADRIAKRLEGPHARDNFGPFDLILAAGDLPYSYLSYLVDVYNTTSLFVAGNHDLPLSYDEYGSPLIGPKGWAYMDRRLVEIEGFLVAGFSGSINYNPSKPYHYSQTQMWARSLLVAPRLWLAERRRGRALDCLLTHSPAAGLGDGPDFAHQGFRAYRWLIDRYRPRYHIHGHVHLYGAAMPAVRTYHATTLINAYGLHIIDTGTK